MQSPERGRIDGKSTQRGQRTMLFPVHLLAPSACHQAVPHQGAFLKGQWKQNQSGEVKLVILEGLPANIRKKGVQQRSTTQNWPQWTTDLSLVAELWEKLGFLDIHLYQPSVESNPWGQFPSAVVCPSNREWWSSGQNILGERHRCWQ